MESLSALRKKIYFHLTKCFYYRADFYLLRHGLENIPAAVSKVPQVKIECIDKMAPVIEKIRILKKSFFKNRFLKRFLRGHLCCYAQNNKGELLFFSWICKGEWLIDETESLPLEKNGFFIYDGRTAPAYKNKGVFQSVLTWQLKFMKEKSFAAGYGLVKKDNPVSLYVLEKMGFVKQFEMREIRIFGLKQRKIVHNFRAEPGGCSLPLKQSLSVMLLTKKICKWLFAVVFYYSGLLFIYRKLLKPLISKNNLVILKYHRILEDGKRDEINISVTRQNFQRQVQYIKRHYPVLNIAQIVSGLAKSTKFPATTLGITFDDGYRNNYELAYPLLKEYGLPAMIFLTVDYIDDHKGFTWDKDLWEKQDTQAAKILSWEEISAMQDNGLGFGSHTLTHPKLNQIDLADAQREISESKRILGAKLNREIEIFSYPHGQFDQRIKKLVKAAGYKAAFCSDTGFYPEKADMFALKRKAIHETLVTNPFGRFSPAMFALEVEGVFDWLAMRGNGLK